MDRGYRPPSAFPDDADLRHPSGDRGPGAARAPGRRVIVAGLIDALTRFYLLASVGVGLEVAFTALSSLRKGDRRFTGHSTLWMFPIYGLAYPLAVWSQPVVGDLPLLVRGLCYVPVLFAVEYTTGWLLRRLLGECPWEAGYRAARWGVHGLIRLDYAPAWFLAGLLFEHLSIHTLAN